MKHNGTLEELITKIKGAGSEIKNINDIADGKQIKTIDGVSITWYQSTGTVQFQGKRAEKERLESRINIGSNTQTTNTTVASSTNSLFVEPAQVSPSSKVFIVHGHDDTAREQLELILHKLGLDPFVLQNNSGAGLTIIEALENEFSTSASSAKFGIVLLTPDDMGYSIQQGEKEIQPRARQNVVLEMGMLISALGRNNVAILKKQNLELPSDAQGILYIPFNNHVKEAVPKLVDHLRKAGFNLSPQHITNASS